MHCWSSSQGSGCKTDPCSLMVPPIGDWIEWRTGVHLSHQHLWLGTHWLVPPLLRYGSESTNLLVQFTLAPQGSQSGACIVQYLAKRAWIRATLVVLITLRGCVIMKLAMDHCSLKELFILQYGSFSTMIKQVKQLAQRTGCSKHPTEWAMNWQLYLNELDRSHPGWSLAQW